MWVRFKVTESEYLAWARRGQKSPAGELTLILADGSEFPSKGRIADTLNQVDPKTGTLELQASFPNPRHTLLPGQFGRIRVQVDERRNAILVPQKAVQQIAEHADRLHRGSPTTKRLNARHRHRQPGWRTRGSSNRDSNPATASSWKVS